MTNFVKSSKPLGRIKNHYFPWRLFVLCLLGTAFLTSCVSIGRQFQLTATDQLIIGTTNMSEARAVLGNPYREFDMTTSDLKTMHFGDEKDVTLWVYVYGSGSVLGGNTKMLRVMFDKNGIVSDYCDTSNFSEDKTNDVKDSDEKDFDIFQARKMIVPKKTTQDQVTALLGSVYRLMLINKPETKERWIYIYTKKSTDEFVEVPTSSGMVNVAKFYEKDFFIDFNDKGIVSAVRGNSDFPADKDKFFTK